VKIVGKVVVCATVRLAPQVGRNVEIRADGVGPREPLIGPINRLPPIPRVGRMNVRNRRPPPSVPVRGVVAPDRDSQGLKPDRREQDYRADGQEGEAALHDSIVARRRRLRQQEQQATRAHQERRRLAQMARNAALLTYRRSGWVRLDAFLPAPRLAVTESRDWSSRPTKVNSDIVVFNIIDRLDI